MQLGCNAINIILCSVQNMVSGWVKRVDTGNAALCIPTQSGPKPGFAGLRCLSLYDRILGWTRSHSKEEDSVQRALVMVRRYCVDI